MGRAIFIGLGLICAATCSTAAAADPPPAKAYALSATYVSDGAVWTSSARVELVWAGEGLTVGLSDARLVLQQASPEQRSAIEEAFGGYEGASATVKLDDRGNILSVGDISSPAATDGKLPVTEADIRRIVGLCILALPATADRERSVVGDLALPSRGPAGIGRPSESGTRGDTI